MTTPLPHSRIARRDLSALTAGIPYVIGFPPANSLVLFTFDRTPTRTAATTMRADLPAPEHVAAVAEHLVAAAMLNQAAAVVAVVVGGTAERHRPLVDALREGLAAKQIELIHASWTRSITHGERWRCYLDPQCTDRIPDPQTTTWAAAIAVAGDPLYRDREEMASHLAPDPPESVARREELLDAQLRNPQVPYTEEDLAADVRLIAQVLDTAEKTPELPVLTDRHVVRLARALSQPEVKDECMAAALSTDPHAAERVWTVLIRALPVPERAEPAVLLALSAYLRGAGVLAALALQTALDANPAHAMAVLLHTALTRAVPPDHLRVLLMRSILRNEGVPDDDPPWETTPPSEEPPTFPQGKPPTPPEPVTPAGDTAPARTDAAPTESVAWQPGRPSRPAPHLSDGSASPNACAAAGLGVLDSVAGAVADPLTAFLPPREHIRAAPV